jgi:glycosyltransferase involved in cell wall biosynthesis
MDEPLVSVLMTVYNAGDFLQRAVESVFEQTYENWELIVCDDGSTDPNVHRILSQIEHSTKVFVQWFTPSEAERLKSVRYATNINWAAQRAAGEYYTFLCGDDEYKPDRLERMVAALETADVVYGAQELRGDRSPFAVRETHGVLLDAFHRVDLNSVMMRREVFFEAGGFPTDPKIWRDADAYFWRGITSRGHMFYPTPSGVTDIKNFREDGVDARCISGLTPW